MIRKNDISQKFLVGLKRDWAILKMINAPDAQSAVEDWVKKYAKGDDFETTINVWLLTDHREFKASRDLKVEEV